MKFFSYFKKKKLALILQQHEHRREFLDLNNDNNCIIIISFFIYIVQCKVVSSQEIRRNSFSAFNSIFSFRENFDIAKFLAHEMALEEFTGFLSDSCSLSSITSAWVIIKIAGWLYNKVLLKSSQFIDMIRPLL